MVIARYTAITAGINGLRDDSFGLLVNDVWLGGEVRFFGLYMDLQGCELHQRLLPEYAKAYPAKTHSAP